MRVVHFSDWHWSFVELPPADLYVCTGDFYDNYPKIVSEEASHPYGTPRRKWGIVPEWEREKQGEAADIVAPEIHKIFGNPDAPLLCVRGNHDFIDLRRLFAQCPNLVHEFIDNEVVELLGLKITGHRGIPRIFGGWSDEVERYTLLDRMRAMPHADVYLTHYPPSGILDSSIPPGHDQRGSQLYGLEGMGDHLIYRQTRALHCFGHIHEWGGMVVTHEPVTFSNAACRFNVIDWNP